MKEEKVNVLSLDRLQGQTMADHPYKVWQEVPNSGVLLRSATELMECVWVFVG